jgi:hypothetical protein
LPPPHRLVNYDEDMFGDAGRRGEEIHESKSGDDGVIDKSKIYGGEEGARMMNGYI